MAAIRTVCLVPGAVRQRAFNGNLGSKLERQLAAASFPCPDILDFLSAMLPGRPFVLPGQKVNLDFYLAFADAGR